ncbi:MAG: xylulokinase [Pelagibacteraceae bacterium]|nr:xylulokinase [Pelagibacteraceae bacterium]
MFIGIDLGTSSVKTILIDENQNTLASKTELISIENPQNGYYEQDPDQWYEATVRCFDFLKKEKPREFAETLALSISGQMHGANLLDKEGKILRSCILWNDTRSSKECDEMEKKCSNLREISGNIAMPGFTAPKVLWVKNNEPDVFKEIDKVLLPKDYLRYRLSGEFVTDTSDASGTLWLDVQKRNWSEELLESTSLNIKHMPRIVEGSEQSATISKSIKDQFGFNHHVIIAGGAGDQAAGAAGSGVINSSQAVLSLGTSGVYFSPTSKFSSNTRKAVHSFCHCLPNTWHHMSVMLSAANCMDWVSGMYGISIEDFYKIVGDFSNDITNIKNAPFFLPYLSGERTPHNNAFIRAGFHSITTSSSKAGMLYALLEGVTFGLKDGFEAVNEINEKTDETYVVGGGAKSETWLKLLSSAINTQIIQGEDSNLGPSLGVARLAMISTGKFDQENVMKKIHTQKIINTSSQLVDILNKRYEVWSQIVSANLKIAKNIINH